MSFINILFLYDIYDSLLTVRKKNYNKKAEMNKKERKSPLSSTDPVSSGLITEEWDNGETRVFPEVLSLQGNAQRSKKSRRMEGGRERGCVQKPRWGWGWWSGKPGECIGAEDQPAGVGV